MGLLGFGHSEEIQKKSSKSLLLAHCNVTLVVEFKSNFSSFKFVLADFLNKIKTPNVKNILCQNPMKSL